MHGPVEFSEKMKPICLPEMTEKVYDFEKGILAGSGWTGEAYSVTLREVDTTIWSQWFCRWVMDQHYLFDGRKDWHTLTR